jgi:hypothetical protein
MLSQWKIKEISHESKYEIFTTNSKRDSFNDKLSSRYMVGQIKQNPFMQTNNYLKDLDTQNNFLIPKSSNND